MTTKPIVLALGTAALLTLSACHTHTYADRETTSRTYATDDGEIVQVHTTERHYFDDDECGGAVSCTSEFVGDVIALPFRAVAGLVDFIF